MEDAMSDPVEGLHLFYSEGFTTRGFASADIYDERRSRWPYRNDIGYVYLYYVAVTDDGRLNVKHYERKAKVLADGSWVPIKYEDVKGIVAELVQNSIDGDRVYRPEPEINFRNVKWRRRSYIALVVDEPYWKLFKKGAKNPPITFLPKMKDGKQGTPNHTFFDATDFEIVVTENGNKRTLAGLFFINHFKIDAIGSDITSEIHKQNFHFNIYFEVAFAEGGDPDLTVIFDPGGTNQGPPLQP